MNSNQITLQDNLLENNCITSIGKRKTAIAKVYFKKSEQNDIKINKKDFSKFFSSLLDESKKIINILMLLKNSYQVKVFVKGGGKMAQLNAIALAIALAIVKISPNQKSFLKINGFLVRDSRIKERRKYGLKKARKASQYSKR